MHPCGIRGAVLRGPPHRLWLRRSACRPQPEQPFRPLPSGGLDAAGSRGGAVLPADAEDAARDPRARDRRRTGAPRAAAYRRATDLRGVKRHPGRPGAGCGAIAASLGTTSDTRRGRQHGRPKRAGHGAGAGGTRGCTGAGCGTPGCGTPGCSGPGCCCPGCCGAGRVGRSDAIAGVCASGPSGTAAPRSCGRQPTGARCHDSCFSAGRCHAAGLDSDGR